MGIEYARNPQRAVYSKDCLYCQYQTNEKGYVTVQYRLGLRPSHLIASAIAFVMGIVLAFFYKNEGPQREEQHIWDDEEDDDDEPDDGEKPYWDVPEPDKDELTVKYHFKKR